ncbi:hypothetical protein KAR91_37130 [Candidatus Pacearchaeota archaeon]|nr:hypothetical protein [Candidatus Pacearchaeota archaeon]
MDDKNSTLLKPVQITCAYYKDGKEKTTIIEASANYNPRDIICEECQACRR